LAYVWEHHQLAEAPPPPVFPHDVYTLEDPRLRVMEDEWIAQMREYCLRAGKGPIRGEIVSVPVPNGRYAKYMVYKTGRSSRVELIWLPIPFGLPARNHYHMYQLDLDEIKRRVLGRRQADELREHAERRAARVVPSAF
jgi:hypothetical protein